MQVIILAIVANVKFSKIGKHSLQKEIIIAH